MELVSVIMPAYNAGKFIAESINSVLVQTYSNLELVIVNDGSTDNTSDIISEYQNRYSEKIVYINKNINEGTALTLNRAIRESKGEYICWLSADDLFVEDTIESLVSYLSTHKEYDMIFSNFELIDHNSVFLRNSFFKKDINELIEKNIYQPYKGLLTAGCIINGCTVIIPKKCFDVVGDFNSKYRYAHDYDMWLRLAAQYSIGFLNKVNVKNRTYPEQISQLGRNEIDAIIVLFDFLERVNLCEKLFKKAGLIFDLFGVFFVLDKLLSIYKHKDEEFETLYALALNYTKEYEKRNKQTVKNDMVTNFFKKCELIYHNPIINNKYFFEDNYEFNYFYYLSKSLQIDGFIINKQALRFDRFQGNDISKLNKGLMRNNTIVVCYIDKSNLNSILKERGNDFRFFKNNVDKQVYKIGITYYMLYDIMFKTIFDTYQIQVTDEDIWSSLISSIIKENLVM